MLCLGLAAAVLAVYGPSVRHDFVNWDDGNYIYANPQVQRGLSWDGAAWAFTTRHASNWHPLTWLSHMLDVELFGVNAGWHHGMSMVLHASNSVLLLLALRLMSGQLWPSAFVAALFALHPLRVESVAWISERKDVLSGLFWMLGLLAYGFYARRPSPGRYVLVFTALALGLLAKPMLVTLPFVLLLLDVWPLGRWRSGPAAAGAAAGRPWPAQRLLLEKLPLFALAAASSMVTLLAQRTGAAMGSLGQVPLSARLANASLSYVVYLWKTIWPSALACIYPLNSSAPREAYAALAAGSLLLPLTLGCVALPWARRRPYLAVGWLWYLGTLLPVIGIVQVGMQTRADRYTYLPLIGIYVMVAWGMAELAARWPRGRAILALAAATVVVAQMAVTWHQVGVWRNSRTLFEHAVAVTSGNYIAQHHLSKVHLEQGELAAAEAQVRQALAVRPDYAEAHNDLGVVLERRGDMAGAAIEYQQALRFDPGHAVACNNLGLILERQGQLPAAASQYRRAIEIDSGYSAAHNNLGVLLQKQGDLGQAAAYFEQARHLDPGNAQACNNLGILRQLEGDLGEAAALYRRAIAIQPDYANAHANLGLVLEKQGQLAEATAHYEQAVRLNPADPRARANLDRARAMLP